MISAENDDDEMSLDNKKSTTELDSHANMAVIGRYKLIINNTGRTAEVNTFTPDCEALRQVPTVDTAISYMCPYNDQMYIHIVRDVLSVPFMNQNFIPPFIMR